MPSHFLILFSPLGTLGLESILVRDLLNDRDDGQLLSMGTAFALRVTGSIAAALLAGVSILYVRTGDMLTFTLVAIAGVGLVFQSFDVIDLWFQSQVRAKFAVYAKNAAFLAMTLVRVCLLMLHAPLVAFAWAALVELAASAAGLVFVYHRSGMHLRRWTVRLSRGWRLLRDSWPLAFANLAVVFYMRIGQVMIGNILSNRELGIYSVAVRLAENVVFHPDVHRFVGLPLRYQSQAGRYGVVSKAA